MAGAHPGGAGQILVIKLVVERAIVQVVWGSGVATITGPHSFGANRRNTCGNRPLNASASLWTLVWRLVRSSHPRGSWPRPRKMNPPPVRLSRAGGGRG